MKFRKKPVVIEAARVRDITPMMLDITAPQWILNAVASGAFADFITHAEIRTLEGGTIRGELDDWLICGVKGELDLCKPWLFEATYEPAEAP